MVSIWNNNLLALGHSALLYLASGHGLAKVPEPGTGTARSSLEPVPVSSDGFRAFGVALAVVTSLGFLMKPTFVLGAVPFAILALGWDGSKSPRQRWMGVVGFLTLVLGLTAPYWGRNLVVHGAFLYSPSFTSSRLALRYGVLGDAAWQTVRFDRPMTYREVVERIGWPGLIVTDIKELAKTAFYSVCLNPAVAAIAAGLLLFWRPDRWRDYAGPLLLIGGIAFEVGVYNHHEFRYLWPIYPPMIALAALAVRDFADWGVSQMTPELARRGRWFLASLGVSALLIRGSGSLVTWRASFRSADRPPAGLGGCGPPASRRRRDPDLRGRSGLVVDRSPCRDHSGWPSKRPRRLDQALSDQPSPRPGP